MDEETVMPYTLRRVTEECEEGAVDSLLDLADEVIRENHPDLADARLEWLVRSGKDKSWYGMARRATEESWILTSGVDLSVQVNGLLWGSRLLTTAGRKFLLDFLLSRFAKKTEGKTHMEVAGRDEPRQLYRVEKQDLVSLAGLIARHPTGYRELAELAAVHKAMTEPEQYLLDLQAAEDREDEEDEDEEEPGGDDGPAPEPVHYFQPRFVDLGDGPKKVTLRYLGPKKDPAELDGVHVHEDQERKPGLPAMVAASSLTYDTSEETVHAYQVWLEDELEDKRRQALAWPAGSLSAPPEGDPVDATRYAFTEPAAAREPEPNLPGEAIDFAAAGREQRATRG